MNNNLQLPDQETPDVNEKLRGIGGWLAFFVFTMFASIIFIAVQVVNEVKTAGAYVEYGLLWAVIIEFLYDAVIIGLLISIIVFVFKRNIVFRLLYIILAGFDFLYCVVFIIIALDINVSPAEIINASVVSILVKEILWVIYLFKSKRVRYTFIEKS